MIMHYISKTWCSIPKRTRSESKLHHDRRDDADVILLDTGRRRSCFVIVQFRDLQLAALGEIARQRRFEVIERVAEGLGIGRLQNTTAGKSEEHTSELQSHLNL